MKGEIAGYVSDKITAKETGLIMRLFYVIIFILIILSFVGILWVGINSYIK